MSALMSELIDYIAKRVVLKWKEFIKIRMGGNSRRSSLPI